MHLRRPPSANGVTSAVARQISRRVAASETRRRLVGLIEREEEGGGWRKKEGWIRGIKLKSPRRY